jgi:hypothetical protein
VREHHGIVEGDDRQQLRFEFSHGMVVPDFGPGYA